MHKFAQIFMFKKHAMAKNIHLSKLHSLHSILINNTVKKKLVSQKKWLAADGHSSGINSVALDSKLPCQDCIAKETPHLTLHCQIKIHTISPHTIYMLHIHRLVVAIKRWIVMQSLQIKWSHTLSTQSKPLCLVVRLQVKTPAYSDCQLHVLSSMRE